MHASVGNIAERRVGAPDQLTIIAGHMLTAIINHEYQHDQWIAEASRDHLSHALPDDPLSGP